MSAIITNNYRILNAEQFRSAFSPLSADSIYLAIGKASPWANEMSPDTPTDTFPQEATDFREILSYKRISQSDTTLAIPAHWWASNTTYAMYDDADTALFSKEFFVITDNYDVYKCIYNGKTLANPSGVVSTVKPTGRATTIITTGDGYQWKYMFTPSPTEVQKFMVKSAPDQLWIPVKRLTSDDGSDQWDIQATAVSGGIHTIVLTNGGSSYSTPPSIEIQGDGIGCTATATVSGGVITAINITTPGTGYTFANVIITGSGSNGAARAIISPLGGHGKSAVEELGAWYFMANVVLAYDEGGDFTVANEYRKIMMIKNPLVYGTSTVGTASTYSGLTKLDFSSVTNGPFVNDELVTQTTSGAQGKVIEWDATNSILYINNIVGTFDTTNTVTGGTSGAVGGGTITKVNPEIQPATGQLLYKDYRRYINRSVDQRESLSIIIEN